MLVEVFAYIYVKVERSDSLEPWLTKPKTSDCLNSVKVLDALTDEKPPLPLEWTKPSPKKKFI